MKGTAGCNPNIRTSRADVNSEIKPCGANEHGDHSETGEPTKLVKYVFLQRKDAKLYGEAGHTGSWRNQTPLHLLETGQVDSFRQWMEAVDGCQR